MTQKEANRIEIYLDGAQNPLATYRPPALFQLDTRELEDGPHTLRIEAWDRTGRRGVRQTSFSVRNGPAITVEGLREGDVVDGALTMLVHAYGGASEENWEPYQAETPAPIPTWAWVLVIIVTAWALFYVIANLFPSAQFLNTPTYSPASYQQHGSK